MTKAFVFPGQGAQFPGMAKDLYESSEKARVLFAEADGILGFCIRDIMFDGTDEDLRQTKVTQPAIFLHSVILAKCSPLLQGVVPAMAAGHSLGEFSALTAAGAISFADGLRLVFARAMAMQECCESTPGTMAAIIGLPDEDVVKACAEAGGTVVAANFNCPGQVVISGEKEAVARACEKATAAGAKMAVPLSVGGAFHSPLMEAARKKLAAAIEQTEFAAPVCPVYQNVTARAETDPAAIKANLLAQLTSPVRWTASVQAMIADGADHFVEIGPGNVLRGLVKRISGGSVSLEGIS